MAVGNGARMRRKAAAWRMPIMSIVQPIAITAPKTLVGGFLLVNPLTAAVADDYSEMQTPVPRPVASSDDGINYAEEPLVP
jgi:hypothetical protein